jgi:hypothetical protein
MRQIRDLIALVYLFAIALAGCNRPGAKDIDEDGRKYNGYVPNALTAKKIAEAVWLPIFGSPVLDEKPYKVTVRGDSVWIVEGVKNSGSRFGGTAYIEIEVKTGAILNVKHGK